MFSTSVNPPRRFKFGRDSFAYANELVWDYEPDDTSQVMVARRSSTPRTYTHRCFVMARTARQFFEHARFDASLPVADATAYGRLVRAVAARNPRAPSAETGRIVVPGYDSLHSFSEAQAAVLMAHCGAMWQSYVLRSHWRMVLPVSRRHQDKMAEPNRPLAGQTRGGDRPSVPLSATDHQPRHPPLRSDLHPGRIGILRVRPELARKTNGLDFSCRRPRVLFSPQPLLGGRAGTRD